MVKDMKERILNLMKDIHEAKELMEINDLLGLVTTAEYKELQDVMNTLVEEYTVFLTKKGKYILLKNCPGLKVGRLSVNKKGFGFLCLEMEDDIYIDAKNMNGAIHDDVVLVEVFVKGVRKEARVIRIVKRDIHNLVGEVLFTDNNKFYLNIDDDKRDLVILTTSPRYFLLLSSKIQSSKKLIFYSPYLF